MKFSSSRYARRHPASHLTIPVLTGWMRWFAFACALLFGSATTAQAGHVHGLHAVGAGQHWETAAVSPDGPSGEEHCPLCVAMHPALPAATSPAPDLLLFLPSAYGCCAERPASAAWHFPNFGRPPPPARW